MNRVKKLFSRDLKSKSFIDSDTSGFPKRGMGIWEDAMKKVQPLLVKSTKNIDMSAAANEMNQMMKAIGTSTGAIAESGDKFIKSLVFKRTSYDENDETNDKPNLFFGAKKEKQELQVKETSMMDKDEVPVITQLHAKNTTFSPNFNVFHKSQEIQIKQEPVIDLFDKQEEAQKLIDKLDKTVKCVFEEYCRSGESIRSDFYGIIEFCHLSEEIFQFGMKPRSYLSRISSSSSHSGSRKNFLTDLGNLMPSNVPSPFAFFKTAQSAISSHELQDGLGIYEIEMIKSLVKSEQQFQAWIRSSLNSKSLYKRIEIVLRHKALIDEWYMEYAILSDEDLKELLLKSFKLIDNVDFSLVIENDIIYVNRALTQEYSNEILIEILLLN